MQSAVKVIEPNSNEVLFTCNLEDINKAYKYAVEMENLGIDTVIKAPGLPETLISQLGASQEDIEKLNKIIEKEIDDHLPDSCCFKND